MLDRLGQCILNVLNAYKYGHRTHTNTDNNFKNHIILCNYLRPCRVDVEHNFA